MNENKIDIFTQNRIFIWIAFATIIILMIPFTAMQFTNEVVWTLSDFITAGVLLFGIGSLFVLTARRTRKYRFAIGIMFLTVLLYVWAELAVGIFTNLGS